MSIKQILKKPRWIILSLSVFLILFSLSLPMPTSAGAWDVIVGGLTAIPALIFVLAMGFVLLLSQAFALIAGALLNWATSPSLVAVSYTNTIDKGAFGQPDFLAGNPIIKVGLDITKNFVNLALVVVLVYIATAIALRLGDNNAKKMFAKLILVALLVNFAPVLVGIIVDASNIVMNYFLTGIDVGIGDVGTQLSVWASGLVTKLFRVPTFAGQLGLIMQVLVMVALNAGIGLAFLLFAVIFIFRYIVIWTLVILSPLAFVAWILPVTKRYWDMWWNNLIQWSVIGIPMAFFIYLGARAFELLPSLYKEPITMPGFSTEVAGVFSQCLPYFVILVFLFLGFTLGLSTSAMGANTVIGLTKRGGRWVGSRAGAAVAKRVQESARLREAADKAVRWAEKTPTPVRMLLPQAARKYAQFRPAVDEARKKASFQSSPELAYRMATGADFGVEAVGNLMEIIERGDSQSIFDEFRKKYKVDKDEDLYKIPDFQKKMGRYLQISFRSGQHNTILRAAPRLARFAPGAGISGYEGMPEDQAVAKAVSEARGQHIKNWEKEELQDEAVIKAGLARGRDFWQAVFSQVKKGHEEPLITVGNIFKKSKFYQPGMSREELGKAWEEFHEDTKNKNNGQEGFFQFLDSGRAKEQGWSPERIMEIATGQRITPRKSPTETPGETIGIKVVTPIGAGPKVSEERTRQARTAREEAKRSREKRTAE